MCFMNMALCIVTLKVCFLLCLHYVTDRNVRNCFICLIFAILGANIFLTSSGLIKLGDFGCSVKLKNNAHTMPGEVNSTLGTAGEALVARLKFPSHCLFLI